MNRIAKVPCVLTIAGSDSGGGAGIQADLKTFAALGVHGMSALTAITAQNTLGVTAIQSIDPEVVRSQIEAVAEDIGVDVVKTGMLHTSRVIDVVAEEVVNYRFSTVVDPVMVAKSGARLLEEEAVRSLVEKLLPLALVVTPNRMEAEVLAEMKIETLSDAEKAARRIAKLGPKAVVVKGGHIDEKGEAVDTLFYEGQTYTFRAERVETRTTHGTGCVFASAISAELAKGAGIPEAVKSAKEFVTYATRFGLQIGRGHGPVNPMAKLYNDSERYFLLEDVKRGVKLLEAEERMTALIPECQSNLAMALSYASRLEDVAAVPGRIVKVRDRVKASSTPEFGASSHVAKTLLAVMKHDPSVRAAMNIKYSEDIVNLCRDSGLLVSFYDRREEPQEVKVVEGMTTAWGAEQAVKRVGRVPDIIYHEGDYGKEPMVTILGRTATEVAERALKISDRLASKLS